jgi:short-subunit dehydrogenase
MFPQNLPLAIVTGASSGIGFELARCCAEHAFDLIIASDDVAIYNAARKLESYAVRVDAVETDLSTCEGVDRLYGAIQGRRVHALLANAGHGLGGAFLDQYFAAARHVLDTNILGTIYLVHRVGREMRERSHGRILLTGSIAGFTPGSFQAVYNGTKAFIDSFAFALRNELKDTGVTVTCLMPGVTDTNFFARANMLDTKVGQDDHKDDPAEVARAGFEAMMKGESNVVAGFRNKLQVAASHFVPDEILAEQHRKIAEPGSAAR